MFWQGPEIIRSFCRAAVRLMLQRNVLFPAAILVLYPSLILAGDVQVKSMLNEDTLRIVLTWPTAFQCQSSIKERELVLQFNQPLQAPMLEALPKRYPLWIEGVALGYDSMLVLAAREVKYRIESTGMEVTITLSPAEKNPAGAADNARGQLRMQLQEVRLQASSGRLDKAHKLALWLQQEYPDDLGVLASLANIEKLIGRWRKADQLLSRGQRLQPENEDLQTARRSIRNEQTSRILGSEERKSVPGQWSEQLTRLGGNAMISRSFQVGAIYDLNSVQANDVQRADGSHGKFHDLRQRGEFSLQSDFVSGLQIKGAVYNSLSVVGGGFAVAYPDCYGRTSLQADFQRPFWEFIEGIVDGGVRDRVELRRTLRLSSRWSGWLAVAGNRYGLQNDRDVARSLGGEGGFTFLLTQSDPQIVLEYGFDTERRLSIDSRKSTDGQDFYPIPLLNREVHSLSASLRARLVEHLQTEGYGGFAYDRLGGNGPFMGVRFTYDRPSDFGAQLWFDRRLNTINTGEIVNRIGGRLLWRF